MMNTSICIRLPALFFTGTGAIYVGVMEKGKLKTVLVVDDDRIERFQRLGRHGEADREGDDADQHDRIQQRPALLAPIGGDAFLVIIADKEA